MATVAQANSYEIVSTYEIYDRDVAEKLQMKFPRASALSWMKAAKGYTGKRKVKRHEYSYWEEQQWFNATATIDSGVNSGTADSVVTLASASHENSGKESYPIVTDLVVFPDETVGYVIAKDTTSDGAHTITVRPINSSQNVRAAVAAGGDMVFYSDAQKERSSAPDSRIPKQTKITNKLQALRTTSNWTDFSEQNVTEWTHNGQTYLHIKSVDDDANRHMLKEELNCLITPQSVGLVDADSAAVQTSNGLIPQIRSQSGGEFTYTTRPDLDDVEAWYIAASDKYAGNEYVLGNGINFNAAWNRVMEAYMVENPGVFFERVDSDKADGSQKYTFDFAGIQFGDFKIWSQKWDVLSHADSLGATGHPYKDMAVCIPIGNTTDPDSGEDVPYIRVAYADPKGAAPENKGDHKIWQTGGNALPRATDDVMETSVHIYSVKGLELRHMNKFFLWTKA